MSVNSNIIHTAKFAKEKWDMYFILQCNQAHLPQRKKTFSCFVFDWQEPTALSGCERKTTCKVTWRRSSRQWSEPKHQESGNRLGVSLPAAVCSSNRMTFVERDIFNRRFGSVWFMHMFTDVFHMAPLAAYCLPLLVPKWITSGQIGGRLWGSVIFMEVTHHCRPFHWIPYEEKTDGPRSWPVWRLKHLGFMVVFMPFCTFVLHLVQRLLCQDPCYLSAVSVYVRMQFGLSFLYDLLNPAISTGASCWQVHWFRNSSDQSNSL